MKKMLILSVAIVAGLLCQKTMAQHSFTIKANEPKADIQSTMWGVFFEDINFGADGGIYAEMVKNRSFEFYNPLMGWTIQRKQTVEGDVLVLNRKDENTSNPRYLHLIMRNALKGDLGLTNEGFRGMGIKKDLRYDFSIMYRQQSANAKLHIELIDTQNNVIANTIISPTETDDKWHKAEASFIATTSEIKGKLNVWFEGNGAIDVDMISLFPSDTWKNRPGGMRADLVQMLADMKPGFLRFPGGCIVEGYDLSQRYQWKNTIGPIEERQLIISRWNFVFTQRPTPDYFQTFGLGFFEYFQLAEDIGAEPLPIINCGMACQYNSAELVPIDKLDPYIRDALDLIEFANGDITTKWGKVRADMGHPMPFDLKMMGIGNENWGPQFIERLKIFTKAIKAKYPDIKLINSSGTDPDGERFNYLNGELRKMNADIIDEHYYRSPSWFLNNVKRYDDYDRKGPKVFAGEYAAHPEAIVTPANKNNWQAALSEAAFMTGLERNADVVYMASYAPLFAHAEAWQWTPDLIWFDNLHVYGTPNYYVQKLFSTNRGTQVLPMLYQDNPVTGQNSLYASAAFDKATNEIILKIVNTSDKAQTGEVVIVSEKKLNPKAKVITLKGDNLTDVNSLDYPKQISPIEGSVDISGEKVSISLAPYSFYVFRIALL